MTHRRSRLPQVSGHEDLLRTHGRRRRRRVRRPGRLRWVLLGLLAVVTLVGGAVAGGAALARSGMHTLETSCSLATATVRPLGETSFVYAADNSFLGAIRANTRRQPVNADRISPWLRQATVAIEDRRFYEHDGLDYRAIARAVVANVREGRTLEGGSTITQQLARNLYLTQERTLERKRHEACLALALERDWSKERILTAYLNRVYYGHRAFGVEAAAQTYFSRRAADLGPTQAALVAGLAQAPSRFDPLRQPERALERRNEVLQAMRDVGSLTPREYRNAVRLPLNLRPGTLYSTQREPYFLEYVRRQLVEAYGEERVRRGGLRVFTTVEPRFQRLALDAMRAELGRRGDPAAAVVSVDPRNGAIRAMNSLVPGSRPDFNLAVQGRRQAGSSFKTFVLVEALRRGAHPERTRYTSAPFQHDPGPGQDLWEPKTYSGDHYGVSTLTQATIRSDNIVYAKLTLDLGPRSVARAARDLGVRSPVEPVASIGLGTSGVSPLDMASAYATLAAGGVYREPYAIRRVELPDGRVDTGAGWGASPPRRVLPDWVAYHTTKLLELNMERGTGTGAQIGRTAAGKTGTTDDHTDAWFVGYTPRIAAAVWVGYPDRRRQMVNVRGVQVTGGSYPASIWRRFVGPAYAGAEAVGWREPELEPHWRDWRGSRRASAETVREGRSEWESDDDDE